MRDNNLWVEKLGKGHGERAWGKAAMKFFGLGWALLTQLAAFSSHGIPNS